jgi:hypothetical protein
MDNGIINVIVKKAAAGIIDREGRKKYIVWNGGVKYGNL